MQKNAFKVPANPSDLFSVIVPSFNRGGQLALTLKTIIVCASYKFDILIHVDAGDLDTPKMLGKNFLARRDGSVPPAIAVQAVGGMF